MIDEKKLIKDLMRTPHLGYYDEDIKTYIDCIPLYTITNIIENQPTIQPQGIDKDRLIEFIDDIKDNTMYEDEFDEYSPYEIIAIMDELIDFIDQQPTSGSN